MTPPTRVQMTRNRPWRAQHPDAVIIDRRTPWGNPFDVRTHGRTEALRRFRAYLDAMPDLVARARHDLSGKDLACWCALDQECHGDIWLTLVNPGDIRMYADPQTSTTTPIKQGGQK